MMSSTANGATHTDENRLRHDLCEIKNYSKNYSGSYYGMLLYTTSNA
ncbi:hypothetical protein Mettu_3629 [Methylobacter tundripaludum SV96]|uniref:Uncharacterized protein n=1 Tax=Methylobacter tundripaludum (strain ATCC BAA-1195 / DSM 17260 / SV96) TaxID=697282 RepID=G3IZW3_METTV|nr:hypothetical protein Mettu_3629 [Methylobacter tundripaludum SV96]